MLIRESAEDYLEAILRIELKNGEVRSIEIARILGYSKPSVSVAMKRLRENGYIDMAPNGSITLLPPGREIAERIYERHRVLTDFLISLGVDDETAAEDACKIEHDLSTVTFEKLREHAKQQMMCAKCPQRELELKG